MLPALLVLLLAASAMAISDDPATNTLTKIGDIFNTALGVTFSTTIAGGALTPVTCVTTDGKLDSPCMPHLLTGRDAVTVSVKQGSTYSTDLAGKTFYMVHARLCYSKTSRTNRAWRKLVSIKNGLTTQYYVPIWKDKACNQLVGSFEDEALFSTSTYYSMSKVIPDAWAPLSTYSARAYVYCKDAAGTVHYCGYGNSAANLFVQIDSTNQQPDWLVGITIWLMCTGPMTMAVLVYLETRRRKYGRFF